MSILKSRLTVVESLYHQSFGEEPVRVDSRFSRELESDEQPYSRRLKATEGWQPLDCGWVKDPGMVCVTNEEGKHFQVNPTKEEKEALARKVLEILISPGQLNRESMGWESLGWLIPPGESFRGCPPSHKIWIRSQSGVTRFSVFTIPK